jgi:hypothetical protein
MIRVILWTLALAYGGFLFAGQGAQSFNGTTAFGAVVGALIGFLLALMFASRAARRKQT